MATGVIKSGRVQEQYLSLSVAGSANVTLSSSQYKYGLLELTGAITANISVIFPLENGNRWTVKNTTTGNYSITLIGASGTGVKIPRGKTMQIWSDGTNVYHAVIQQVNDQMLVGGVILADTSVTASVVGTTETAVWTDAIEMNRLAVADILRIHAAGLITRSGSGPNLTMRLRLGTGTLTARPILASTGAVAVGVGGYTASLFEAWVMGTIRTIGASGTIYPQGRIALQTSGSTLDNRAFTTAATSVGASSAAVTIDTTVDAINITLTVEWSANTAGNVVTINECEPILEAA